jgi:DNA invertase Pin-like site-specific DNA recombinase
MNATNRKETQAESPDLTPKQERAILALLSEGTTKDAAAKCGVNEATIWRWLQLTEFQERYRGARRQVVETAISQLQSDCTVAARVLREVAEDTKAPSSSRVMAARTILEQSLKAVELMDLVARVDRLEKGMPAK